jgi:glycosyltransferase involved in cell wall biosynthesis
MTQSAEELVPEAAPGEISGASIAALTDAQPHTGAGLPIRRYNGTQICVVLPAYNEELTISGTIRGFASALPDCHIAVVDNNSSDRTAQLAALTLSECGIAGTVLTETRQGKANAVRHAFRSVCADVYVLCDADLTYPANRVHELIAPIVSGEADMTVADRISGGHYAKENRRRFHSVGNEIIRRLVNFFFNASLRDIMSGYRAFSSAFVRDYPILVSGFQLETDMTLHALDKRYRIREITLEYADRPPGSHSKLNTFADGARVLFTIAQLLRHYRPMFFFAALAALFAISGLIAAIPVFEDWLRDRYIYHVPLAILSAALELAALSALGIGLVLDAVNYQFKLLFERGGGRLNLRARNRD